MHGLFEYQSVWVDWLSHTIIMLCILITKGERDCGYDEGIHPGQVAEPSKEDPAGSVENSDEGDQ